MRKLLCSAAAVGALLGASTLPSGATTVTIGFQEAGVNSDLITSPAGASGTDAAAYGVPGGKTYGTFSVQSTGTAGADVSFPDLLSTNSVDVKKTGVAAGTIDVFVTAQGLTSPLGSAVPLISGFSSNVLTAGWTVTEETILSASNALWGGGNSPLDSATFTTTGATNDGPGGILVNTGAGPYSLTEEYIIEAAAGGGTANLTMDLSTVPPTTSGGTPLPGALALFGGGLALLGGAGWRKRRKERANLALSSGAVA